MDLCIRDIMLADPLTVEAETSVRDAARQMQERYLGDVLVTEGGELVGIITDRDIVVRCVAEGMRPEVTTVGALCSKELFTLEPSRPVREAIELMKEKAVRRVPVVEDGHAVGVLSLGDLAIRLSGSSPLAQISAAPPRA